MADANTDVTFFDIDVDEAEEQGIEEAKTIDSLPTFVFFRDGIELAKVEGANIKALKETVANLK